MAVNQSPMAGSYHAGTARTTPTASGNSSSSGRVNRYLYPQQRSCGMDVNAFFSGRPEESYFPPLEVPPNLPIGPDPTLEVLQSITVQLVDIKNELSCIRKENYERDTKLDDLKLDVQNIKDGNQLPSHSRNKAGSHKSPPGLNACVRKIHGSFEEKDQFNAQERVNSPHNQTVTSNIVKNIVDSGEFKQKDNIAYAAKKYHEYLVRLEKPTSTEKKRTSAKMNRAVQRRQRIFERRRKYCKGQEIKILQVLSEKFMSDEETDSENAGGLIRRPLQWRSKQLNVLFEKLDQRYLQSRENKENVKPLKQRRTGQSSVRPAPKSAPQWAISESYSHSTSSSDDSVSPPESAFSETDSYSDHDDRHNSPAPEADEDDEWMYEAAGLKN